ncbi:MAG TPA: flagellar basal-body MS-ring/collar protein FliF [Bryobacteraceae bacterium]|nr:flagellar basal-body MS-ring/collar protein FliF [Bryobacteraceae bacterium]
MFEQWKAVWTNLSIRHRITIGLALGIAAAAVFGLTRWQHESDFKPLYTGMSAEDAGAVVAKLKESGVEYRVSDDGSTVLARSSRQAELRLELASAGLPKTGRIGFELFDKTNLGMTDFAEQVNYRRALEGELERSMRSISQIEQARVHITFPKDSVFLESRTTGKASVLLKLRNGAKLSPQQVTGISHMVASAVDGLAAEAVSVMDMHGTLLHRPKNAQDDSDLSDEAIEYKRRVERDLLTKINATLEPLLGPERFRAGVSVECDFTSGEQSEETYDPEKSVMSSSQKTEESTTGTTAGGVPGTASALPRPTGRTSGSSSTVSRRSETIAFQTSKTVRRIKLPQGAVSRVSASVLVDQTVHWEGSGSKQRRVVTPPSAETVRAIRVLVSGAIGLQPERGDQLVVESLPFESTLQTAPPPSSESPATKPGLSWQNIDPRIAAGVAGGALVLILTAFMLRRRALKRKAKAKAAAAAALPPGTDAAKAIGDRDQAELPEHRAPSELEEVRQLQVAKKERLVGSVKNAIGEDPALVASVLRTWLEEK